MRRAVEFTTEGLIVGAGKKAITFTPEGIASNGRFEGWENVLSLGVAVPSPLTSADKVKFGVVMAVVGSLAGASGDGGLGSRSSSTLDRTVRAVVTLSGGHVWSVTTAMVQGVENARQIAEWLGSLPTDPVRRQLLDQPAALRAELGHPPQAP